MRKVSSPNCEVCEKPEDVYHILTECVRNRTERQNVLRELGIDIRNIGIFHSILSSPNSMEAKLVYKLVRAIE